MKQEEERREMRLQAKVKQQREDEEKIRMLQHEATRIKKIEEMREEESRHQQMLDLKFKKQKEHEERIRLLQEEEHKYKAMIAAELEQQGQFQQFKANQEEKRRQDLQASMLKQEKDSLLRQTEIPVVRPKERKEEQKVEWKQESRVDLNEYVNRERQTTISDREFDLIPHAAEQINSERSEIELLKSRLVSLEKQLQQKEHYDSQYSSISAKADELERKEALLGTRHIMIAKFVSLFCIQVTVYLSATWDSGESKSWLIDGNVKHILSNVSLTLTYLSMRSSLKVSGLGRRELSIGTFCCPLCSFNE